MVCHVILSFYVFTGSKIPRYLRFLRLLEKQHMLFFNCNTKINISMLITEDKMTYIYECK